MPHQRAGRRLRQTVTDVCKVGDEMQVKVIAVDDQDRVKLTRKAALAERGQVDEYAKAHPASERPAGGPPRRAEAAPLPANGATPANAATAASSTAAVNAAPAASAAVRRRPGPPRPRLRCRPAGNGK